MKYPAGIDLSKNGRLSPDQLQGVILPGTGLGHLHPAAARNWGLLAVIATAETGQAMSATSIVDTYRPYGIQEAAFVQRYQLTYIPGASTKYWQGKTWYLKKGMAMAAVPGTSNHGLGLAIDMALWVQGANGQWRIVSITSNGLFWAWLTAASLAPAPYRIGTGSNLESFGFSFEAQSEPWHIRLVSGGPTQRVLDIEAFFAGLG